MATNHAAHAADDGPAAPPFEQRLAELRARHGDHVALDQVAAIVAALLHSMRGDISAHEIKLYGELESLARYIHRAKEEIRAIQPDDIQREHIPLASGELDAIGTHLEEATGTILDACEGLENAGREIGGELEERIGTEVTRIYEACSFQDLAGQRITKIIATLQTIERRVDRLIKALGDEIATTRSDGLAKVPQPSTSSPADKDAELLNGPQRPGVGNSQADIDALFASLA